MSPERTPSEVVTGITEHLANRGSSVSSAEAGRTETPTQVVKDLGELIAAVNKYGVTTAIFALPLVVTCFGLYFLWIAVSGSEANGAKIGVGIFTVVFGSGLLVLLIWLFNRYDFAKKVAPPVKEQKKAAAHNAA